MIDAVLDVPITGRAREGALAVVVLAALAVAAVPASAMARAAEASRPVAAAGVTLHVAPALPGGAQRRPLASAAATTSVTVRRSRYGRVLFDGRGRALYLFTRERSSRARCYGACAAAWPPFLTTGRPSAGRGARDALIGTTRRRDGTTQVTYRGRPLYFYVNDREPGQILCQDVVEFGGTWLVVAPDGTAVR